MSTVAAYGFWDFYRKSDDDQECKAREEVSPASLEAGLVPSGNKAANSSPREDS